jgi:hypothetical protein
MRPLFLLWLISVTMVANIAAQPLPELLSVPEATTWTPKQKRLYNWCRMLNGELETGSNRGAAVDWVWGNRQQFGWAYCGRTVARGYEYAGIRYDVVNPNLARNNFLDKSQIVYARGKYQGVWTELESGYVAGMKFGAARIAHVGIFWKLRGRGIIFEGNTSNPRNRRQQGFFFKAREVRDLYVRRVPDCLVSD